jgi:mono/diheme cytochrome c family protein
MEFPSAPASTNETIELGKKLYEENGCLKCHGNLGRGDGPSAPTLVDDFGHPIRAADLSQRWTFRGGPSREDIFRTMTTGLNGTPMPSFADALTPDKRWAITDFIASLSSEDGPGYTNLVVAKYALDPIDLAKGAASFEAAPVARFPIIGQITEPGRQFHPPATSVRVQAIYDTESIAVLVRWHDLRADNTGKNDPSLAVPIEEEEEGGRPSKSDQAAQAAGGRSRPLCGNRSGADRPAIGVQRRGRDSGPERRPDGRAQALLHLRRRPELRRSLVLRSGPPGADSVHRPGQRGSCRERHRRSHGCRELRPGRMVGHLQAAASPERGRRVHIRGVPADRLSRSGTGSRAIVATSAVSRRGTRSTWSPKWSHRRSARWRGRRCSFSSSNYS